MNECLYKHLVVSNRQMNEWMITVLMPSCLLFVQINKVETLKSILEVYLQKNKQL